MKCPADILQGNGLEVYSKFLKTVEEFQEIQALPVEIDFVREGSSDAFLQNNAKWHKEFRLKFTPAKLESKEVGKNT